ncbi:MAG: 1-deoxy-D-xylulose-5-phosphate reductoisomerase [Gammaproteobacteria bacterium]
MTPLSLVVLGSTGSIGQSTLDVVARHPGRFRVLALVAGNRADALYEQVLRFAPRHAVLADESAAVQLGNRLRAAGSDCEVSCGTEAMCRVAVLADADAVMSAVVGAAGLAPTLAAVRAGKRVLLANKESLVMSGRLFMAEARRAGAVILPIDSEHNAVFQCLPAGCADLDAAGVRRILLTASGGPFRTASAEAIAQATPAQAVAHPNWSMGRKISVDSATMMNKGLEVIEAHYLFGARPSQIDVVVHPQSVVHSMVEYVDGSVLAQLGSPDMRTPIAHALAWPERVEAGVSFLDLVQRGRLDFEAPDETRFPCLRLAREAMLAGGNAPAVLNAANEVAVEAFLEGRLSFPGIAAVIADTLAVVTLPVAETLDALVAVDASARRHATTVVAARTTA